MCSFPEANQRVNIADLAALNSALRKSADVGYQTPADTSLNADGRGSLSPLVPQSIENTLSSATYTMKELVTLVEKTIREPSGSLNIPSSLGNLLDCPRAALQASIPFPVPTHTMHTSEYIDEMESDLVVDVSSYGLEDLGIEPQRIDQGVPIDHVRFWRSGAYDFGSTFE